MTLNHKQLAEHAVMLFRTYPDARHEGEALVRHHGGTAVWEEKIPADRGYVGSVRYPDGTIYTNAELEAICQIWLALKAYEQAQFAEQPVLMGF